MLLLAAGWLGISMYATNSSTTICPLKLSTGLPCAGCGGTRATLLLLHGHWADAVMANPLALLLLMVAVPGAMLFLYDRWQQKNLLYQCYQLAEQHLRKPLWAMMMGAAIAANWIWNLYKY